MKTIFASLVVLVFATTFAFADNDGSLSGNTSSNSMVASFNGKVTDLTTNESLAGVKVTLEGSNTFVYTDLDGNFKFEGLKAGKYTIVASYISYKNSLLEGVEINTEMNKLEIKLKSDN